MISRIFRGERLEAMLAAGEEVLECQRVLKKAGLNVAGEVQDHLFFVPEPVRVRR